MKVLGLDIGTTTVSAIVAQDGAVVSSITLKNDSFLPTGNPWEKIQSPEIIRSTALQAVETLLASHPDVARIGVTGQMHGIVYLDGQGNPVSPLYTWQDGRGDQPYQDGLTYAAWLRSRTGYPVATGYGLVTHFYNIHHGLVDPRAKVLCTIHDYIAMVLAGKTTPVTEASDAASLGLFQLRERCFDPAALEAAGIEADLLPALAEQPCIGYCQDRLPVFAAIGDNQASFLGATGGNTNAVLLNVGTGSQVSIYVPEYMACSGLETRPFPGGGYLLVGAPLCGGRAYALLERFFRMCAEMAGCPQPSLYDAMAAMLEGSAPPADLPTVTPLFQGSREDPTLRGRIEGLSTENFTPLHLTWGMMEGMARELHDMYRHYLLAGGSPAPLVGSGNGLRKNPWLQSCFYDLFGQPLTMSQHREEAALGAAVFAASGSIPS